MSFFTSDVILVVGINSSSFQLTLTVVPLPGLLTTLKSGVDGICPFAHDAHAQAGGLDGGSVKADPVICNFQQDITAIQVEADLHLGGAREYFTILFRLSWAIR